MTSVPSITRRATFFQTAALTRTAEACYRPVMPSRMFRLHCALVAVLCFYVAGGHWMVLQSIAWAGMLASRTQETSLPQAVASTFGGDAPCAMCRAIQDAQEKEHQEQEKNQQPALDKVSKLLALVPVPLRVFALPRAQAGMPIDFSLPPTIAEAPPTPPPRHA